MICICGHEEDIHYKGMEWMHGYVPGMCTDCWQPQRFHEYNPDNLKYLERLYEKRNQVVSL